MLNSFRVCPQRFFWEHGCGLRDPAPAVDLVAGGAFAAGREALYRAAHQGADRTAALSAAQASFDRSWGDFELLPDSKSPKTKQRTWEALVSYAETYSPPEDSIEPWSGESGELGFEWRFKIPLAPETTGTGPWPNHPETGQPFFYGGRCDAVGRLHGALPVVLDDKTTSRFESAAVWSAGLQMRAQLLGYVFSVQQLLDPTCDTALVRQTAIRSSGVEHRESPLIQFSRFEIGRWLETTRQTLWALVRAAESGQFPPVLGDACVSWGRLCEFAAPCRSAEPAAHLERFVERRWDPLAV